MKNDQKEKQSAGNNSSMPWPDKNAIKQQQNGEGRNSNAAQQEMPWPDSRHKQKNKQNNQQQTGNNMSIGNDPATANNSGNHADTDPEINAPIYNPEKTIKKIPVMKEDSGKPA